jgi:sorbitol/mannitol transport system permease protein
VDDSLGRRILVTVLGWGAALLLFFPIFWMVLTSFKTERDAISASLTFTPTLDAYRDVLARADYLGFAMNSVAVSVGGTMLALPRTRWRFIRRIAPAARCYGCYRPRCCRR